MTDEHRSNGIAYRADIDGLRAVAIVPVVFYHGGIAPFTAAMSAWTCFSSFPATSSHPLS